MTPQLTAIAGGDQTNLRRRVTESSGGGRRAIRLRLRSTALAIAALGLAALACRPSSSVHIAWDAPTPTPKGYRILVDDRVVMTIPPPPLDPACSCPAVWVPVPPGEHKISVVAYSELGDSPPTTVTFVKK